MDTVHDDNVYLGLGSNLGNRSEHLRAGLAGLCRGGLRLRAVSSLYLTEPDLRVTSQTSRDSPTFAESRNSRAAPPGPTAAAKASEHPPYVNCVAAFESGMQPRALLDLCLAVEASQGRTRASEDSAAGPQPRMLTGSGAEPQPRTLDIDVLLIGQRVIDEPGLRVPHPLMMQRRFVLQPLAEIAPALRHPIAGDSIREALAHLPEGDGVELLAPPPDGLL